MLPTVRLLNASRNLNSFRFFTIFLTKKVTQKFQRPMSSQVSNKSPKDAIKFLEKCSNLWATRNGLLQNKRDACNHIRRHTAETGDAASPKRPFYNVYVVVNVHQTICVCGYTEDTGTLWTTNGSIWEWWIMHYDIELIYYCYWYSSAVIRAPGR